MMHQASTFVADNDLSEQVSRLEDRIKQLRAAIETCRKLEFLSKIVLAAGAALVLSLLFGIIRAEPLAIVTAIAALVGGTVLFGSNASTWTQAATDLKLAEAQINELIDSADLRLTTEQPVPEQHALEHRSAGP
jgi:outer membrane murein-binding lipoprotein Lpp